VSTIEEVRAAEKKVQEVLLALKEADVQDPNHLSAELKNATDEYARAVRELDSKLPHCAVNERPSGHAASLKVGSTVMRHSSSSHSGM